MGASFEAAEDVINGMSHGLLEPGLECELFHSSIDSQITVPHYVILCGHVFTKLFSTYSSNISHLAARNFTQKSGLNITEFRIPRMSNNTGIYLVVFKIL